MKTNSLNVAPYNIDAEKAVLGSVLREDIALEEIDFLQPKHFYQHGEAFGVLMEMRQDKQPVDVISFAERFMKSAGVDSQAATDLVYEFWEAVPHGGHAKHYAEIVREKWLYREIIKLGKQTTESGYAQSEDPEQILAAMQQAITDIDSGDGDSGLVPISQSCHEVIESIRARQNETAIESRITTGYPKLDNLIGGLRGGQMITLAAGTGFGKTAFALNIAHSVLRQGRGVMFVSLEMSHQELTERLLAAEANVNSFDISSGQVSAVEFDQLTETAARLSKSNLHFLDNRFSLSAIVAKANQAYRKFQIQMVVVDYLQLCDAEQKRGQSREQAVSAVSREMKRLAMELRIPVLALAQLNREFAKRNDKRPQLSDLRESGAIEQDSNIVLFIHRPDAYDAEDRPGQAEIIVAKNRSGPTGIVEVLWQREYCRFESIPEIEVNIEGLF
jgi:replicative DNA helicase